MKKLLILFVCIQITSCTTNRSNSNNWDFDHNLQFDQKKLSENVYQIIVHRKKNTRFPQLSSFLMRHALNLCQSYGFKLEIIEGVEDYNEQFVAKSYIQPALKAKIECPKK